MNRDHDEAGQEAPAALPFPSSLCHRCGAPARYVTTHQGSVFIQCPVLKRYPPQPVRSCDVFVPPGGTPEAAAAAATTSSSRT